MATHSALWRAFAIAAGLLLIVGGPLHPGGTMAEMLAHPQWVLAHALLLAGFVALLIALVAFPRPLPELSRRWLRLAVVGTAFQAVEMAFHTAAVVDHANLVAGRATPILTTHLWLTAAFYPVFGVTFAGFVVAATRDRVLGSWKVAWLGIIGALAHGAAGLLVVAFGIQQADILFPLILFCALWLLLIAGPQRSPSGPAGTPPLPA
jgi:hypothetical protein